MSQVSLPAETWELNAKEQMVDRIASRVSIRARHNERDTVHAMAYWLESIEQKQREGLHVPVYMLDRIDELRARWAVLKESR